MFGSCSMRVFVFFFFFQAEDGIRDGHVTGVQTCALPISCERPSARIGRRSRSFPTPPGRSKARIRRACSSWCTSSSGGSVMLYDLARADLRIKWLVTCLLATLGVSYAFGALMVSLYAGFTPGRVAATYAGPEMSMPMPPETTM